MKKPSPQARKIHLCGVAYWRWVSDGVVWLVEVGGHWAKTEVPE